MNRAIVMVSVGTKYSYQKKKCLDPYVEMIQQEYRTWQIYESFSSSLLSRRLQLQSQIHIQSPREVMHTLKKLGCKRVMIQPFFLTEGHEYDKLIKLKLSYSPIMHVTLGKPLLSSRTAYSQIITELSEKYKGQEVSLILVVHPRFLEQKKQLEQEILSQQLFFIHVILLDNLETIADLGLNSKKIIILPFMLMLGTYILREILDNKEARWRCLLEQQGYQVEVYKEGIGCLESVKRFFRECIDAQLLKDERKD